MDPSHVLFLSLLAAHLVADFVLQSSREVAMKRQGAVFAKHIVLVTLLSGLLAGDWRNWIIPLVIGLTHALVDWAKLLALRRGWPTSRLFFWDQAAHLAIILGVAAYFQTIGGYSNVWYAFWGTTFSDFLILVAGIVVTVRVGGIVIAMASADFLAQVRNDPGESESPADLERLRQGLRDGGKVIGQLERGLIFFFVLIGKPEAVAFLVAAKSVFRFGELTRSRKEAEYILIGTLMSFGWGLAAAWLTFYLLGLPS